jgi:hypothetical protein
VALNIMMEDIVWINGPFPCGRYPNISIFWSSLKHELSPGEKAEADLGYRGEQAKIWLPVAGDDVQQRVRLRQFWLFGLSVLTQVRKAWVRVWCHCCHYTAWDWWCRQTFWC